MPILGEVLLILSVEREGNIFNHRAQKFLDGLFHPAHPSVVAHLAYTRKAHFLVLRDFRRRVAHLPAERLASVNALKNPTREQILFRVGRVATEDAGLHGAKAIARLECAKKRSVGQRTGLRAKRRVQRKVEGVKFA